MQIDSASNHASDAAITSSTKWRVVKLVGLGVLSFLLIGLAISIWYRATEPRPPIAVMDEKIEAYTKAAGAYDIVFVGSSQTFRHIVPSAIDAALAKCGHPVKTFNFGVPALRVPEVKPIIETITADGQRPKLVIMQNLLRAETGLPNMMSERGRHFRGGDYVGKAVHDVKCYTGRRIGQARSALNASKTIAAEAVGIGRLGQKMFAHNRNFTTLSYDGRFVDNAGFWPVDQDPSRHVRTRPDRSPMTDDIIEMGLSASGFVPSDASVKCRANQLGDVFNAIEEAGIEAAYWASPNPVDVVHDGLVTAQIRKAFPDMTVLDFNSSEHHQAFFKKDLWFDYSHMTEVGARQVSERIGAALCAVLDE